jgi:hypothetical protein
MKYRNNKEIDAEINAVSTPESGARGTNCGPDETLQKGHSHKTQTEFTAKESTTQSAAKSIKRQVYGSENGGFTSNSNPKARAYATSGVKNDVTEGKR